MSFKVYADAPIKRATGIAKNIAMAKMAALPSVGCIDSWSIA